MSLILALLVAVLITIFWKQALAILLVILFALLLVGVAAVMTQVHATAGAAADLALALPAGMIAFR